MPWTSPELLKFSEKANFFINREFSVEIRAQLFIVTKEEMTHDIIEELKLDGYNHNSISILEEIFIPKVIGKYFKRSHEIWIIQKKGENLDTVIHEYLHSIQKCSPNREGIVDYITYKITGNQVYIDPYDLKDWREIEKTYSYKEIKVRLLSEGDCEHF